MTIPAFTLTSVIADAALVELANRQAAIDAAEARAALLERELAFVNERLADANARADRLAMENRNLRALAEARLAAIIGYTMQRSAEPLPDIVRPGAACSIMIALRSDPARDHSHACAELAAMLARQSRGSRHE